jgi:hypothetical protein
MVGSATILVGALLLSMAVPRLIANLLLAPGNVALSRVLHGDVLSAQGYERILSTRKAALSWVELPEARLDLGATLYLMAQSSDQLRVDPEATLGEARRELERGLAELPADTYGWFWLADIRKFTGEPEGAARALRLSSLAAPHDVNAAPLRAGLALALWAGLDPETKALAEADVRGAFSANAGGSFIRRMRDADLLAPLRRSVASDPVANASLWLLLRHDRSAG